MKFGTKGTESKRPDRGLSPSDVAFTALSSLVIAFYLETFREVVNRFRDNDPVGMFTLSFTPSAIACIAGISVVAFAAMVALQWRKRALEWIFTWRYPIAAVVLALLVIAQVSGSSIALWDSMLNGTDYGGLNSVAFGMPRTIRSDEYLVFTPMALSQEACGYAAMSDIMRSVPTDVTLVYAQPCWDIATLFRPFLWGYLVLGGARGLSFFWCGRVIGLFLVSFEFGRFITRDNRPAALAYALIVSLSPVVQWWFSVNGTAELLICAQGGVLAFGAFLRSESLPRRIAMAALAAYAVGCFVMVIYPAWQVCIAYVIVALCIADIVYCRKHDLGALAHGIGIRRAFTSYWLVLLIALAVVACLIAAVLLSSIDVVNAVRNTSYPGHRVATGGRLGGLLFDWAGSWLYPLSFETASPNACERASVFTLFPLGIVLAAFVLRRKRDPYLIALIVAEAILIAFGVLGFPEWLAKITLLSNVLTERLVLAIGLSDAIILFRSAQLLHESRSDERTAGLLAKKPVLAAMSLAFGLLAGASIAVFHPSMAFKVLIAYSVALSSLATYAILAYASGSEGARKIACAAVVVGIAGLCVNPVQIGTAPLTESPILEQATEIAAQDKDAVWAGDNNVAAQALLASGIRTINSVATYPDLDTWRKIDPDGAYHDAYNRYAHIAMHLTDEPTSFSSEQADTFSLALNVNDLPKLGVKYWFTQRDLTQFATDDISFTPIADNGIWKVYRIDYEATR